MDSPSRFASAWKESQHDSISFEANEGARQVENGGFG